MKLIQRSIVTAETAKTAAFHLRTCWREPD